MPVMVHSSILHGELSMLPAVTEVRPRINPIPREEGIHLFLKLPASWEEGGELVAQTSKKTHAQCKQSQLLCSLPAGPGREDE